MEKSVWESSVVDNEDDDEECDNNTEDRGEEGPELDLTKAESGTKKRSKKVEEDLLEYIQSRTCRRDVCVRLFNGPALDSNKRRMSCYYSLAFADGSPFSHPISLLRCLRRSE